MKKKIKIPEITYEQTASPEELIEDILNKIHDILFKEVDKILNEKNKKQI